jgi:DNA-nicking Smr family endonuclease
LKIQADKAKQCPQCPLCRYAFDPDFIESIPSQLIEKDQEIANLILNMPTMGLDEKIDITERLFWTHRFEQSKVVDAIEALLDSKIGGLFFRQEGELTSEQKNDIYCKARLPVEKLETKLKLLLQEQSITVDQTALLTLSNDVRQARKELAAAREKARDDIYSQMNSVSGMGAEQEGRDGTLIRVDFHGLLVNEMRMKFNDQIMPILPVVKRVMIITGRGSHSAGKEAKLKKALFKLVSMYQSSVYWQPVDRNPGALYVVWRDDE